MSCHFEHASVLKRKHWMRCHVPVTSSRGGSVLKCIDEGEDKSTSQVDYKPIVPNIGRLDKFLYFRLSNAIWRRYRRIAALSSQYTASSRSSIKSFTDNHSKRHIIHSLCSISQNIPAPCKKMLNDSGNFSAKTTIYTIKQWRWKSNLIEKRSCSCCQLNRNMTFLLFSDGGTPSLHPTAGTPPAHPTAGHRRYHSATTPSSVRQTGFFHEWPILAASRNFSSLTVTPRPGRRLRKTLPSL